MDKEVDMGIDMYSFNRVNMGQLPYLETEEIECAKQCLKNYINHTFSTYYMLLNHDNKDFTLFHFKNSVGSDIKINTMANDIIECMENRGFGLLEINSDETGGAQEVWVKDKKTETVYMYLLFPYDMGVIEY